MMAKLDKMKKRGYMKPLVIVTGLVIFGLATSSSAKTAPGQDAITAGGAGTRPEKPAGL